MATAVKLARSLVTLQSTRAGVGQCIRSLRSQLARSPCRVLARSMLTSIQLLLHSVSLFVLASAAACLLRVLACVRARLAAHTPSHRSHRGACGTGLEMELTDTRAGMSVEGTMLELVIVVQSDIQANALLPAYALDSPTSLRSCYAMSGMG